jgi:hypothetical protein
LSCAPRCGFKAPRLYDVDLFQGLLIEDATRLVKALFQFYPRKGQFR